MQIEARIYVGLCDKDSHEQELDTKHCKEILKNICKKYNAPFSLQVIEGGYFYDDGTWVDENTLLITMIGNPKETVYNIANDLCSIFNQESILVTCTETEQIYHRVDQDAPEG